MPRILIMKFGGTSVGTADHLETAVRLVAEERHHLPLVVVSALSGITDQLVKLADDIASCRRTIKPTLAYILSRHRQLAEQILPTEALFYFLEQFYADYGQLERFCKILQETGITPADRDVLLSFGERFSSRLFVAKLKTLNHRAHWCDAHNFLITDNRHGDARPNSERSRQAARSWLTPLLDSDRIVVTQGFVGSGELGRITTLGRGGSDYTATFLGSILCVAGVQIWSDVNGVFTNDPNKDPEARQIPRLNLTVAYRMAAGGAKVIYAPCLLPLFGTRIPLSIRNTRDPRGPYTQITESGWENETLAATTIGG